MFSMSKKLGKRKAVLLNLRSFFFFFFLEKSFYSNFENYILALLIKGCEILRYLQFIELLWTFVEHLH